ncbi:hypothetical protein Lpar_2777 [Legionella parisiensis]|uniref:Uncharacterized protein n=1 Tax=Legionella parisiensis TaxID=45071 RepID=A0A1E5JL79_9GAMM|nr:hypothetical protein Lpar_2777 [Legionella parisiensis]OEH45307.1 hypothetical protein lpari_03702 [Legionella parisiensis]STX76222.1 Uncharacterised protein [Legionella parisiensis]
MFSIIESNLNNFLTIYSAYNGFFISVVSQLGKSKNDPYFRLKKQDKEENQANEADSDNYFFPHEGQKRIEPFAFTINFGFK